MRTMMKVCIDVEAGNRAMQEARIGGIIGRVSAMIDPEASYFLTEGGRRTALFFFDMTDPAQIPSIAEPFFTELNAEVDFVPVMDFQDLQRGVEAWDESRHVAI